MIKKDKPKTNKSNNSRKVKKLIISCTILCILCILILVCTNVNRKKYFVEKLANDCCFFIKDFSFEDETLLYHANQGDRLYAKDNSYYINKKSNLIDERYPAYQNDGATLYFPVNGYRVVYEDFTVEEGLEKSYISCGLAFDQENKRSSSKNIMLLKVSEECYINSNPIQILQDTKEVINANSMLFFYENEIVAYEYRNTALVKRVLPMKEDTMIELGDIRRSYYELFLFITNNEVDRDKINPFEISEEIYFYYMKDRYVTSGSSYVYKTKTGYLLENQNMMYELLKAPLYLKNEKKLILPTVYELVQPYQHWLNRLPDFTYTSMDEYAVYFDAKNLSKAFNDVFLYDGSENYIVFKESILSINGEEIAVSPFSSITVEDQFTISVYQYDTGVYTTYYTKGSQAILKIFDDITVQLLEGTMTRKNNEVELLVKEPAILPLIQ